MEDNIDIDIDQDESSDSSEGERMEEDGEDGEALTFDISIPATHSYLGELAAVGGAGGVRAGWAGRVAAAASHVVFPGEMVPMLLTRPHDRRLYDEYIAKSRLLVMLCPDESGQRVSRMGSLCEVLEAAAGDTVRLKARAAWRCRVTSAPPMQLNSCMELVHAVVLADEPPGDPLRLVRLPSLDVLRHGSPLTLSRVLRMEATRTPWPAFVTEPYSARAVPALRSRFAALIREPGVSLPEDPLALSFLAANLNLSPRARLRLLREDCAVRRLRLALALATRDMDLPLCCRSCRALVAQRDQTFAMSTAGVHAHYTNSNGYMHDVVTVRRCVRVARVGEGTAAYSWYPGYAWSAAACAACAAHVGWRFDALKPGLRPQHFFALSRQQVTPQVPAETWQLPSVGPPTPPLPDAPDSDLSDRLARSDSSDDGFEE